MSATELLGSKPPQPSAPQSLSPSLPQPPSFSIAQPLNSSAPQPPASQVPFNGKPRRLSPVIIADPEAAKTPSSQLLGYKVARVPGPEPESLALNVSSVPEAEEDEPLANQKASNLVGHA
eukprot:CAMPEP_0184314958 /NCGR_PEP_ID=MMETSP1049-20130417/78751_1 /TAXON_ID=77928 /ORGANISM="Proteomonas sulcata, Strain CCMP704" /LENGTH=119 /DNA_ID=CAMNT_0026633173 /DNA_START=57 /DNA_END=416 /DNA_ORIENTATION=-